VRNAVTGIEDAQKGYATDTKGRKTVEVGPAEATTQALGFVPYSVGKANVEQFGVRQDIGMQKQVHADIVNKIAEARADRDTEAEQKARAQMQRWNEKNPDSPIHINAMAPKSIEWYAKRDKTGNSGSWIVKGA